MEFNSSYDQTNFRGYYPPSPISNDGWEYHQQFTNSEHSNSWKFASETQDEQENHMGYFPPPQNDSSNYSNGDWEYCQEKINDEAVHMRYDPEPQDDLCHHSHGGWAYHQEYEQSSEINYFPEPQSDSYGYDTDINCGWEGNCNISSLVHQGTSSFDCVDMQNCPPMPQDDPYCDEFNNSSSCAWEDQNQRVCDNSYSIYQEPSSLEQTFNSFMQTCQTSPHSSSFENPPPLDFVSIQNFPQDPYDSIHQSQNSFHYTNSSQQSKNPFHNSQDSSHTTQNNLIITHSYPQSFFQPSSCELAVEDPLQKSRELLKRQEQLMEEQEQSWKEQETLFKKIEEHLENIRKHSEPLSKEDEDKLMDVKDEVEEQEEEAAVSSENSKEEEMVEAFEAKTPCPQRLIEVTMEHEDLLPKDLIEDQTGGGMKEDNQEKSHSIEAEDYIDEGLIETPMQEALDEEITPIITQQSIFESKEVKATTNPVPDPATKLNQAHFKRKLAEERPREGTRAESYLPLRSFLLTNWKKRKKVKNNMSS